ncbi:hypothetical protein RYX36_002071 [Vicia faba]
MVAGNGAFGSLPSASEITKRNILAADDRFGSSGMVQPLVSPLSNRLILPQVGKTNDGTASVDSSTVNEAAAVSGRVFSPSVVPGMQWRPGSPFPNQKDAGQLRGRTEIAPDQREKFFCRSFSKCNKGPVPFLICLPLLQEIISSFLPNNKVHLLQQFISLISSLNLLQSSENHRLLVHLNLIILIRFDHTHVCQFHCRSNYNPSVNHQTPSGSNNPLPLVFDIPCAIWRRTARPLTDFGFGDRSIWEGVVGLFLVSGAVLLALSLAWLKGFQIRSKFRKYTATFEFSQASGISTGTPVRIRGVTVGDVIRVNPSLTSIEAVVEIEDDKTIIPCNSLVEVNQSGLLMETIIDTTLRDPLFNPLFLAVDNPTPPPQLPALKAQHQRLNRNLPPISQLYNTQSTTSPFIFVARLAQEVQEASVIQGYILHHQNHRRLDGALVQLEARTRRIVHSFSHTYLIQDFQVCFSYFNFSLIVLDP